MKKYEITALAPSDIDKLASLLSTRDDFLQNNEGALKRATLQLWIAFKNPSANGKEPTYYIIEDENKILAFHGCMPGYFSINGQKVKGYYVHDLYVDPEIRKKGEGFWMTMSLASAMEKQSDSFICLFGMTPLNLQMQRRRKYHETGTKSFVKILRPHRYLAKKIKVEFLINFFGTMGGWLLNLYDFFSPGSFNHQHIEEIEHCDNRFDRFMEKNLPNAGISSYKDAAYLNWKYLDRPYKRERCFALVEKGQISGLIVLGLSPYNEKYKIGVILEIMVTKGDDRSLLKLVKFATNYFKNLGAFEIQTILTQAHYIKIFKKHFYLQKEGKTVMIGNLDKFSGDLEYLKDIKNWHMTFGESDAFMLNY